MPRATKADLERELEDLQEKLMEVYDDIGEILGLEGPRSDDEEDRQA